MSDYDDFCRSLEWEESLKDYEQESFEREVLGYTYDHEEYKEFEREVLGYTYDHEEYKECECECECRSDYQPSLFWLVLIWCILFVLLR